MNPEPRQIARGAAERAASNRIIAGRRSTLHAKAVAKRKKAKRGGPR